MDEDVVTNVRVSCPSCGQMKVTPEEVTIRNCVETDEWSYSFFCDGCQLRAAGSTNRHAALDAIDAGSTFETWRLPVEMIQCSDAPPLTWVDILELRLALIEPNWIDELTK